MLAAPSELKGFDKIEKRLSHKVSTHIWKTKYHVPNKEQQSFFSFEVVSVYLSFIF